MPEKVKKEGGAAPVHVMINAPGEARRSLLSLAIDLVRLQKKHRDFLNRKKEKEETGIKSIIQASWLENLKSYSTVTNIG